MKLPKVHQREVKLNTMKKKLKQIEKRITKSKAFLIGILEEDSGKDSNLKRWNQNSRMYEQYESSDSRNVSS